MHFVYYGIVLVDENRHGVNVELKRWRQELSYEGCRSKEKAHEV